MSNCEIAILNKFHDWQTFACVPLFYSEIYRTPSVMKRFSRKVDVSKYISISHINLTPELYSFWQLKHAFHIDDIADLESETIKCSRQGHIKTWLFKAFQ